jgi:hypothetical protein
LKQKLSAKYAALAIVLAMTAAAQAVIVDRIAVIVGNRIIKASDIDRDLRVTQFLNRETRDSSAEARHKAAERLIDQMLIREEIVKGAYTTAGTAEMEAMLKQIRQDRFGGAVPRMNQELARYGLTEEQLRIQLQWQLDVLKFIDQRFRPGVLVTDEEVRSYYDQHTAELRKQFPGITTFEGMAPKIRASLEGERLNQGFEQWLAGARKRTRIEYRQEALQ